MERKWTTVALAALLAATAAVRALEYPPYDCTATSPTKPTPRPSTT